MNVFLKLWRLISSRREEIIESQHHEIGKLQSQYRKLYDEAPDMYRTINTDGIIMDCNQSYVRDLGYSNKDEVIGHSIFEHISEDSLGVMQESFDEWRNAGKVRNKEVWFKRKDGSIFPVLISANNLYDDNGKLIGSNSAIVDETEMYNARQELERANEEVSRAYQMQEEFIRIAAHELRTPIQPILMMSSIAKSGAVSEEKAWEIVNREAKRLKRLADDILDVSRIGSGKLPYDMQNVRIGDVIAETSDFANLAIQASGKAEAVTMVTILDNDHNIELCIDKNRMIQALRNIINNSVKFTDGGRITIEGRFLRDKKLFQIEISDTGPGISEEMLPRLFGKFAAMTSGKDLEKQGTGLGLFISRSIIQAHRGHIFVCNKGDGIGAAFLIRLPI